MTIVIIGAAVAVVGIVAVVLGKELVALGRHNERVNMLDWLRNNKETVESQGVLGVLRYFNEPLVNDILKRSGIQTEEDSQSNRALSS